MRPFAIHPVPFQTAARLIAGVRSAPGAAIYANAQTRAPPQWRGRRAQVGARAGSRPDRRRSRPHSAALGLYLLGVLRLGLLYGGESLP